LNECEIESLRTTLARFGCTADPEPLVAPLEEYWLNPEIYEDAIAFLESVRLPVCCVSNADTEPLRAAMDRHGLVFDAVITSEDARAYKPDAEIFRQALSALDVSPEATIHVGDSLHSDIGGASMLGISTAWIRRDSRIHDIGNSHPDWTFATLTEMSGII
jgi:2-haloacid dehalogenase/putative hydrolase of the HAD superfamily